MNRKNIIYFDNSATTWPKPNIVAEYVNTYFNEFWGSPNRTSNCRDIVGQIRRQAAEFFGENDSNNIAFVNSATMGMNIIFNSLLNRGDHVITTNCEHHCVYRPLENLKNKKTIHYDIVPFIDKEQSEFPERIIEKVNDKTKLVVVNHGSNVTGAIFRINNIGRYLREKGILFVVDISQTAGIEDISLEGLSADVLVTSAHKHLFGLPGAGLLVFRKGIKFIPFIYGGTGINSALMQQPLNLPHVIEVGTINVPALLALSAGMEFCSPCKRNDIKIHQEKLINHFISNCRYISNLELYCREKGNRTGIISFNIGNLDPTYIVAPYLAKNNVIVRAGLHCAPMIHKTIGTYPKGTTRISFSLFNTINEIDEVCELLEALSK